MKYYLKTKFADFEAEISWGRIKSIEVVDSAKENSSRQVIEEVKI